MVRQILDTIGNEWDLNDPAGAGFARKRFLQNLSDVVARPINNRVTVPNAGTVVALNATPQSTGIGTGAIMPSKFAETQLNVRVTLNTSMAGNHYVYIYRTTGVIPPNGSPPNVGDVIVGGDAFGGGQLPVGVDTPATLSFIDQGLESSQSYKYYFAVTGPNGANLTLKNGVQLMASEF